MEGNEVQIRKVGNAVILLPMERAWDSLIESLALFTPDFAAARVQPVPQKRKNPFR